MSSDTLWNIYPTGPNANCRAMAARGFAFYRPQILTASAVRRIRRLVLLHQWALSFAKIISVVVVGSQRLNRSSLGHSAHSTHGHFFTRKFSLHRLGWPLTSSGGASRTDHTSF